MSTATVQTITTMLERLPDHLQQQTYDHLTEYLEELYDEAMGRWVCQSQDKLTNATKVKTQSTRSIQTDGLCWPMNDALANHKPLIPFGNFIVNFWWATPKSKKSYHLWRDNPFHRSLRFKCTNKTENIWSAGLPKAIER